MNLVYSEGEQLFDETKTILVEKIREFAESDIAKIEQFHEATTFDDCVSVTKLLLESKIENLRDTGTEEEFAEFERRLTLASIDELWMQHIDHMAHLREEVAFE